MITYEFKKKIDEYDNFELIKLRNILQKKSKKYDEEIKIIEIEIKKRLTKFNNYQKYIE